ncbi:MAG: ATP-binding protein [Buchananella hordeovulneris]|nr:ATP-binding protein [Buchananella hordeovulneris]
MIEVAKLHVDEQVDYDIAPVQGHSQEDLDANLVASYVKAVRTHARRLRDMTDEQILRVTNVLTASGEPTIAGLYALGHYPQGHFPALTVTAAVQLPGGEGRARNRNLEDFTGPLPVLLSDVLGWVETNLASITRYRPDGHMEAVSELPLNAVRELVANALVHRDLGPNTLGMGKQVQIRITPKSLFIQSPGGLKGVSLSQLESMEHAQAAVNQRLYQIAKRLTTPDGGSVIEGEGGGIREVFRSAQERGLHRPQLIDTGVQFKALLWRPLEEETDERATSEPHQVTLLPGEKNVDPLEAGAHTGASSTAPAPSLASSKPTVNEPVVLAALVRNPAPLTIHELAAATSLTLGQLRYALAQPLREGVVVMDGRQGLKTTRYSVKSSPHRGR